MHSTVLDSLDHHYIHFNMHHGMCAWFKAITVHCPSRVLLAAGMFIDQSEWKLDVHDLWQEWHAAQGRPSPHPIND